jgi:hypothetical protein
MLVEATPTHECPRNAEACNEAEGNDRQEIKGEIAGHDQALFEPLGK